MADRNGRIAASDEDLSSEELERVIRRAAELQTAREVVPERLDDDEVIRIGAEVGLQEQHLRQALLELRAEAMIPGAPADRSVPRRLWGAALIQASRVVPGQVVEIQARLDEYLLSAEGLRQIRSRSGLSVWEPASDLVSQIRRGLNLSGHGFVLAKARRIEVAIQLLEPARCLVTVSADLRNERTEHAAGWYTGVGLTALGATVALVAGGGIPLLLAGPLAGAVGFGGGTVLVKRTLREARERTELAVQGLLDRLERGGRITPGRPGLIDRIQGLIGDADRPPAHD